MRPTVLHSPGPRESIAPNRFSKFEREHAFRSLFRFSPQWDYIWTNPLPWFNSQIFEISRISPYIWFLWNIAEFTNNSKNHPNYHFCDFPSKKDHLVLKPKIGRLTEFSLPIKCFLWSGDFFVKNFENFQIFQTVV